MMRLITAARIALEALPGPTPIHAEQIALATANAAAEATCTAPYEAEDCRPTWRDRPVSLVVTLVGVGHYESRFLPRIQAGNCKTWECDAEFDVKGRFLHHKARSYWQLQRTSFARGAWDQMVGVELIPTYEAARVAARVLAAGYKACRSVEGAISWYGAQHCRWPGAAHRYALVARLERAASVKVSLLPQAFPGPG